MYKSRKSILPGTDRYPKAYAIILQLLPSSKSQVYLVLLVICLDLSLMDAVH